MKVLVTGAKGMLGQDLCPVLEDIGCFVIETDIDNLDITDEELVCNALKEIRPNLVIHCAAYTNVNNAEEEPEKALSINSNGTEYIAKACNLIDATMIYISTDYVFDGTKNSPYTSEDMPNPINIYGKTKLAGEEAVKKHCKKFYIIRTSWLYGIHGNNFVEKIITLAKTKKEISVVDDQIGCPTWTLELVNGILQTLQKPYGTYHICGSGKTSWYNFAKKILEFEKINTNIIPTKSSEVQNTAKRPKYSVMDNNNICRNWEEALINYLNTRQVQNSNIGEI